MKKSIFKFTIVAVFGIALSYNIYSSKSEATISDLVLDNIEALARAEQPDVADCIADPDYDCEALHPKDPSKDKRRNNARW